MNTIHKTILEISDKQSITIPSDAEIICAREQFDNVCIWYSCSDVPLSVRWIFIVGTGHPLPNQNTKYLGTASLREGNLILHVFEAV